MIDSDPNCEPDLILNLEKENFILKLPPNHFNLILSHYAPSSLLYHFEDDHCVKTYFKNLKNPPFWDKRGKYLSFVEKSAMIKHGLKRKPPSFIPYFDINQRFVENLYYLGEKGCIYILMHITFFNYNKQERYSIILNFIKQLKNFGFSHAFMASDIDKQVINDEIKVFIKKHMYNSKNPIFDKLILIK
jgi:hypothetical protein